MHCGSQQRRLPVRRIAVPECSQRLGWCVRVPNTRDPFIGDNQESWLVPFALSPDSTTWTGSLYGTAPGVVNTKLGRCQRSSPVRHSKTSVRNIKTNNNSYCSTAHKPNQRGPQRFRSRKIRGQETHFIAANTFLKSLMRHFLSHFVCIFWCHLWKVDFP